MHSPTLALAWQVWGRHRWGLAAVAAYCLVMAVVFNALPAETLHERHGALFSIQFVIGLIYVAAAFAYGFECRLEVRESGFPARLFTLPVRTGVLVGGPMLQGMAAVALLWLAWAYFVLRPCGIEVSLGSTALLAAAFVAVLQALLWSPVGLPWLRVVLAIVLLPLLAVAPQLGPALGINESLLVGLYAALIPLAAAVAFAGVSRTRHGAATGWRWPVPSLRTTRRPARLPRAFPSPARAQLWYEWRRHLLGFPLVIGCCMALQLALVLWIDAEVGPRPAAHVIREGLGFLLGPLIMAPFFGCFLARTGTSSANPYLVSSFTATRPVSVTTLVAAKLKGSALVALAAWALVLLAASVWLAGSGSYEAVSKWWQALRQQYPAWRVAATALLAVGGPVFLTWRLLADNLWVGLTGRVWVARLTLLACGACLPAVFMLGAPVVDDPGLRDRLWEALPWYAAGAALLKLLAAAWVGRALLRRGLVGPTALAKLAAVWLLAAVILFALACAAVPSDLVPVSLLASGAVLGVPLVRLLAAPLALAWNRHR
jgi:hypothetical protein